MQNPAAEQVIKALKEANNVLVTVKNSPSVDELAAAIALTLILNHLNKHAITVFSGRVPSTLEFLQPEMAIDTNTDSLRDFIIALDKSKADKLRYKVEDNVVRIFITPYKTSISEKDLEFSQGDFNVDVVVALGVVAKEDFDQAVTVHGRILHDATVVTLTRQELPSQLGAINWNEPAVSSISEMITSIVDGIGDNILDGQTATALLTGIVAETDRFKNANTTPQVLSLSSKLMSAGANQQLIAEKLEEPDTSMSMQPLLDEKAHVDGALEISHDDEDDDVQKIHIDDSGNLQLPGSEEGASAVAEEETPPEEENHAEPFREYIQGTSSPLFGQDDSGNVSAQPLFSTPPFSPLSDTTSKEEAPAPPTEPVIGSSERKVIEPIEPVDSEPAATDASTESESAQLADSTTQPTTGAPQTPVDPGQTLSDLEQAVESPHVEQQGENDTAQASEQSVDDFLGTTRTPEAPVAPEETQAEVVEPPAVPPADIEPAKTEEPKPDELVVQAPPQVINPTAPPAVPPPLMPQASNQPQFYDSDGNNSNPFLNPS